MAETDTQEAFVAFERVQKSYDGETLVVKDLNLAMPRGEFLTMLGPSGSGKTTCLMMLAGFETATHGEIKLGGQPINNIPPHKRGIGMVFQNYALFPHMTVAENLAFPLEVRSLPKSEREEKIRRALDMVQMGEFGGRRPAQLSGGQQQRIALARALVFEPELVLMDEPLGALDKQLREHMQFEITNLAHQLGITVVYVTHDQTEAMTMGDRIAILNEGRLQQVSTPLECYNRPNNLFVAGFIGDPAMNFFSVRHDDGMLEGDRFSYAVGEAIAERLGQGQQLILGIRPEDISLEDDATATDSFDALVDVVEPHGHFNDVHLRFTGDGGRTAEPFTMVTRALTDAVSGEEVQIRFPKESIHLFDAASEEAVHNPA